jgi:hypothetical protein
MGIDRGVQIRSTGGLLMLVHWTAFIVLSCPGGVLLFVLVVLGGRGSVLVCIDLFIFTQSTPMFYMKLKWYRVFANIAEHIFLNWFTLRMLYRTN